MITSPDLGLVHALRDTVVPVSESDRHDEWLRHFLGAPTAPDDYPGTPPSDSPQA